MTTRICAHCGEQFQNITDHLNHVMQRHDTGMKPRTQRVRRAAQCWSCAAEIPDSETHCICGALHPRSRQH